MWLKLIIFAVVAVAIYRFFGGKVPFLDRDVSSKKEEEHDFGKIEATSECTACGTYMTEDDALIYQKKSYCSSECLAKVK
jgi:uncharacterized protein